MAFASTITRTVPEMFGRKKAVWGTYTNGAADSGGNIDTGLTECDFLVMQPTGAAVVASNPSVNETYPCDGSAVTVVNTLDEDGAWFAIGR